jgi:lipopolysaccharide transport system permease protein
VFVYAGLLPWGLFASVVNGAAMSVVSSQQLISKIYFPRLFIPLATVGGYLLDNLIATLLLIGLIAFYGLAFSPALLLWPLVVLLTVASSLGIGLYFAALNVSYRDFRYVIPFFLQFLLYATPVIYPLSILPESLRYIMYVNPMTGIIGASRSLFLGDPMPVLALAVAAVVSGALLYFGLRYYARVAQKFADVI